MNIFCLRGVFNFPGQTFGRGRSGLCVASKFADVDGVWGCFNDVGRMYISRVLEPEVERLL